MIFSPTMTFGHIELNLQVATVAHVNNQFNIKLQYV